MISTTTLPEFFHEKVETAASKAPVKVSQDAAFYIVNLLTTFCPLDGNSAHNKGHIDDALALYLLKALSSAPQQKVSELKKLGDLSLFVSGFFAESLSRKIIDIDYYINMGHAAYSNLSSLNTNSSKPLKNIFVELAKNFIIFVDIISEVRDSTPIANHQELLKLYDRWLNTGSPRSEDILKQNGIMPNALVKTPYRQ